MKLAYCLLFLAFGSIHNASQEVQSTKTAPTKVSFAKEVWRVVSAMPYTRELYHNVRLIHNDPGITKWGSYQSLDNDGCTNPGEGRRDTVWYPFFLSKKTAGSSVIIDGRPIYYKMYMPEGIPLKAIIFDIYGGTTPRDDAFFGWYYNNRVLASQGYGVVVLSLSDVQDRSFPINQADFTTAQFEQLKNEIKVFITECFAQIKANGCETLLSNAQRVPHFLMGHSFGGLLTLKCATDPAFLSATNGFLHSFIAQAPETYELASATDGKTRYYTPISVYDDLTTITGYQLLPDYSPLLYAANLQKPVFLMHSHYDMRVPLDHTLRFYEAAKRAGKDNLVSLWVNEEEARHNGIEPSAGTLSEAKIRVDREVTVIKDFIDGKNMGNGKQIYALWHYAYPPINSSDKPAIGLTPIKDDKRSGFYRTAVAELEKISADRRDIDTYVRTKLASIPLDYTMMYSLLEQMDKGFSVDCGLWTLI